MSEIGEILQHVDQSDQGTDHTEGRGRVGAPFIHGDNLLMALRGLLDIIFQNAAHPVRVVGVYNEHDCLLKEGVFLLLGFLLQGKQAVLSGNLRQLGQLLHILFRIERVQPEHDFEVLGEGLGQLGVAGHHHRKRTAKYDQDTGGIYKIDQCIQIERTDHEPSGPAGIEGNSEYYKYERQDNAEQINNVHLWFSSRTKMQSRHITLYTAPRRLSRGECPVPWRYTLRSSR